MKKHESEDVETYKQGRRINNPQEDFEKCLTRTSARWGGGGIKSVEKRELQLNFLEDVRNH
jgi:hypothetical protein